MGNKEFARNIIREIATDVGLGSALVACMDAGLSPRSRFDLMAANRKRLGPPPGSAAFSISALAPNATSAIVSLSSALSPNTIGPNTAVTDAVRRGIRIIELSLSDNVSYKNIQLNITVGGGIRESFSGSQLDPTTQNACIGSACKVFIVAGNREDIGYSVTNVSGVALADGATIRVEGRVALEGDPDFIDAWQAACRPFMVITPGGAMPPQTGCDGSCRPQGGPVA